MKDEKDILKGRTLKKDREVDQWKYDRFTIKEEKQEIQRIGTIKKRNKETSKQTNTQRKKQNQT